MRFQGENQVFGKAIIFQKYDIPRCARRIWNPLLFDPVAASINADTHTRCESYTFTENDLIPRLVGVYRATRLSSF